MNKFVIKQCKKCGAKVEVLNDCHCTNCGILCCGQQMTQLQPNSEDCNIEKHLPCYEVVGNYIVATVPHVMEKEHYIEFLALSSDKVVAKKFFDYGDNIKAVFPYIKGSRLTSSCNKHGLWEVFVE